MGDPDNFELSGLVERLNLPGQGLPFTASGGGRLFSRPLHVGNGRLTDTRNLVRNLHLRPDIGDCHERPIILSASGGLIERILTFDAERLEMF